MSSATRQRMKRVVIDQFGGPEVLKVVDDDIPQPGPAIATLSITSSTPERKGEPRVLHIRRYEATANRRASLRSIPTKKGFRPRRVPALQCPTRAGRGQTCATCAAPRTVAPAP